MSINIHVLLSLVYSGSLLFLILVPLSLNVGISPFSLVFWSIHLTFFGLQVFFSIVGYSPHLKLGDKVVAFHELPPSGIYLHSSLAHWMLSDIAVLLVSLWPWHAYWIHYRPYAYVIPAVSVLFELSSAMTFVWKLEFSQQAIFFHTLLGFHYRVEKGDFIGIVRFRGRPYFTYVYIRRGRFADLIDLHNPLKTGRRKKKRGSS